MKEKKRMNTKQLRDALIKCLEAMDMQESKGISESYSEIWKSAKIIARKALLNNPDDSNIEKLIIMEKEG
jgi:hypothetical protein